MLCADGARQNKCQNPGSEAHARSCIFQDTTSGERKTALFLSSCQSGASFASARVYSKLLTYAATALICGWVKLCAIGCMTAEISGWAGFCPRSFSQLVNLLVM